MSPIAADVSADSAASTFRAEEDATHFRTVSDTANTGQAGMDLRVNQLGGATEYEPAACEGA